MQASSLANTRHRSCLSGHKVYHQIENSNIH
jgi:hypothetical protein